MKINDKYYISARKNFIETNLFGSREQITNEDTSFQICVEVLRIMKKRVWDDKYKNKKMFEVLSTVFSDEEAYERTPLYSPTAEMDVEFPVDRYTLKSVAQRLINFFSEFQISPSLRFIDTFIRTKNREEYVINYFKLCDSPWINEITQKVKSSEFSCICDEANKIHFNPRTKVNKHLSIFFGPAGTGKTTDAMNSAVGCIPCSSDMDCKELLKDFKFNNGAPTFEKSDFWTAIEEGKTIVLDEINLLNRQVLQFLQALTDGKDYVDFEGTRITIHPDFKVIGTMNLIVNGMTFALSEPLVDRCSVIKDYSLTADGICNALLGPEN